MYNWAAGIITLLIIAAFFWPQSGAEQKTQLPTQIDTALGQSIESGLEQEISKTNTFSRSSDNNRAQQFRLQEAFDKRIKNMLSTAQKLVDSRYYTLPEDNNAIDIYQEVLVLDPKNKKAKQGIEFINDSFLKIGLRALKNDNLASAQRASSKLTKIDRNSEQNIGLKSAIEKWQSGKELRDMLKNGKQAFAQKNYISPATQNALYFFEEALKLDPSNKAAAKGIEDIINIYIQRTRRALKKRQYSAASTNLEILTEIDPSNANIRKLREKVINALR